MLERATHFVSWLGGMAVAAGLVGVAAAMSVDQATQVHPNWNATLILAAISLLAVAYECQAVARIRRAQTVGNSSAAWRGRILLVMAALYTGLMQFSFLSESFDTQLAVRDAAVQSKASLTYQQTLLHRKLSAEVDPSTPAVLAIKIRATTNEIQHQEKRAVVRDVVPQSAT